MKNNFLKFATAFVGVAVALSSCTKEQSSYNIYSIPGKATIMGTCYYDAGQGYQSGSYTQLIKPAANVKVIAKVSNASLSPNQDAGGYTHYETTTDATGAYEIEVPAVEGEATNVKIEVEPFFGTYSTVKSVSNGKPEFDVQDVLFDAADKSVSVKPRKVKLCDVRYSHETKDQYGPDEYSSKFIVKVGEGRYSYDYTTETIAKYYAEVSGKNVIARVDGVFYGATTNSNGEATFIIPSKSKSWTAENVLVRVEGYVVKNYTCYQYEFNEYLNEYRYVSHYIEGGTCQQLDDWFTVNFSGIVDDQTPVCKVRMVFCPFEGVETYGYAVSDWTNFSWE